MTEHQKLKEICDTIGYINYPEDIEYEDIENEFRKHIDQLSFRRTINVREIIFTQTFMDKYKEKVIHKYTQPHFCHQLTLNLDNPLKYLHNLIEWKE